jgi:hypothetical protein
MKLVLVNWNDAAGGNKTGWRTLDSMKGDGLHAVQSVGFLLRKTDELVTVVPHVSGERGDGEIDIPCSWIVGSIVELAPRLGVVPEPLHTNPAQLEEAKDE